MSHTNASRPKSFIVKERSYEGVNPRTPYQSRQTIHYGPWRSIGYRETLEDALLLARKRVSGIFERCVFYGSQRITDATHRIVGQCRKPQGGDADGRPLRCKRRFGHRGDCTSDYWVARKDWA